MLSKKRSVLAAAALVAALSLSACSQGSSGSDASASVSPEQQKALDAAYTGFSLDLSDLPSVKVTPGKNLYVISCGQAAAACASVSEAVKTAAEVAGWTATIADGKLNPDGFAAAIRQAIAGGANVIIPMGMGCGVAQAAWQEAKTAGITVVGGGGVDNCDPKLWATERKWIEGYDTKQYYELTGTLQAQYAYGKLGSSAKAIVLNYATEAWGPWITDAFKAKITELGGEVVDTVDISGPDMADGSYVQKVTSELLSHPDANVLVGSIDSWFINGLSSSIVQAGLQDKLLVVSRNGDAAALDLIRQGGAGLNATVGISSGWGGWGSVDTALRVVAGQEPQYVGDALQVVDADHNMPASGTFDGSVDYQTIYRTAWGVK